jgi:flagellar hook-associated protein 1 FlgK
MARLNAGISQESAAATNHDLLSAVESTLNELTDNDISSGLSDFFNVWSEMANSPGDGATRNLVIQQGSALAGQMRSMRSDLLGLRAQVDQQLDANSRAADDMLSTIANLNREIVTSEGGVAQANGLRDQRDQAVQQLAQLMDITSVEQPDGSVNILVGSLPVVLGGDSRGVQLIRRTDGNDSQVGVYMKNPQERIEVEGGRIGALLDKRDTLVNDTIAQLDKVAGQLIFQVNRIHSQGYGTSPLTNVTGTQTVSSADVSRAFNDPANGSFGALPFQVQNGGFNLTVRNAATGESQTVRINVDLDGLDNTGAAGTGDDTSLQDIRDAINAVPNMSATINANGTLSISGANGYDFSFSEDSSGVLAVLGVNTYFTGTSAADIDVRQELVDHPSLLAAGRVVGGEPNDNGTALAITNLQDQALDALGGGTIRSTWSDAVQEIGIRTDAAANRADATTLVRQSLEAQQLSVSGVSVDEESINLITYQRQYEGAARFISVVDELTQTLISIL